MAIAHDATSTAQGTGTLSWTHTPVGTPAAVSVIIAQAGTATDEVTGVTYGGVAMTRVRIASQATGEAAAAYAYELLASIPTGAQTVQVSVSGATDKRAVAATMTGGTIVRETDNAVTNSNATNPSIALTLAASSAVYVSCVSGDTAANTITDGDYTVINEEDSGSMSRNLLRRTSNAATGTETVNWTFTNDEVCAVAVAYSEVSAPTVLADPVLNGACVENRTLYATTGLWTGSPSSYAYQWQDDSVDIGGETASSFTPDAGLVGSAIRCEVTATNGAGDSSPAFTRADVCTEAGTSMTSGIGRLINSRWTRGT